MEEAFPVTTDSFEVLGTDGKKYTLITEQDFKKNQDSGEAYPISERRYYLQEHEHQVNLIDEGKYYDPESKIDLNSFTARRLMVDLFGSEKPSLLTGLFCFLYGIQILQNFCISMKPNTTPAAIVQIKVRTAPRAKPAQAGNHLSVLITFAVKKVLPS